MVILDTCALINLVNREISLSAKTLQEISKGAYILSVSFAEIACKIKLGKLSLEKSPRELHQEFSEMEHISILDIGIEEWLDCVDLTWPDNRDPVDRMITAFAMKKELDIITSDDKIKKFYKKVLW